MSANPAAYPDAYPDDSPAEPAASGNRGVATARKGKRHNQFRGLVRNRDMWAHKQADFIVGMTD